MSDLSRIGFIGEVPGQGSEIVVVNDNDAEISTEQPTILQTRVIAHIAVTASLGADRSQGFSGEWRDAEHPESTKIAVRILGEKALGYALRVAAVDPAHQEVVRTRDGHRYFLHTESA